MATITFGYGKTYDWSSTYWSTLTNVQDTNLSSATASDGWKVLAFVAATKAQPWDDLTGWTAYNHTTEISPAGIFHALTDNDAEYQLCLRISDDYKDTSFACFGLLSMAVYGTSTNTGVPDSVPAPLRIQDGTRAHNIELRSDGSNIDAYCGGATKTKHDTSLAADSRWHLVGIYNNNSANGDVLVYDGLEIFTNGETYTDTTGALNTNIRKAGTPNPEYSMSFTNWWNAITPWETSDGVMESDATSAVFDAGAATKWQKIEWTADASNGSGVALQYKCANSTAALASATYRSATSGTNFSGATPNRYIQVKATLTDGSSGQYTPALKDLTATSMTVVADSAKPIGGCGFGKRR